MAHHDCDKEESDGPGCQNLIYELELYYIEKEQRIIAKEKLIRDSAANRGQIWALDYSFGNKRLFYTDVDLRKMR